MVEEQRKGGGRGCVRERLVGPKEEGLCHWKRERTGMRREWLRWWRKHRRGAGFEDQSG